MGQGTNNTVPHPTSSRAASGRYRKGMRERMIVAAYVYNTLAPSSFPHPFPVDLEDRRDEVGPGP